MGPGSIELSADVPEKDPPFVETAHPLTGEPILLVRPPYSMQLHRETVIKCMDAASFAAAVKASTGTNKLVELTDSGLFRWHNERGPCCTEQVYFQLQNAPTRGILCLSGGQSFGQRELIKWHEQWPDTLAPHGFAEEAQAAVWEAIAAYKISEVKAAEITAGEDSISVAISTGKTAGSATYPRLWDTASPVFAGHAEFYTTLRLEIIPPEVGQDGKVTGSLQFAYNLWQPAASVVLEAAMLDAQQRMQDALPDLTVIRGSIG
jgi:hypothetical protein